MAETPGASNFLDFCSALRTPLSRREVARLYGALGWEVRKCTWVDYAVRCEWAKLTIEAESPILMHGPIADTLANAERVLASLRDAGVAYEAECYDEGGRLLREFRWNPDLS